MSCSKCSMVTKYNLRSFVVWNKRFPVGQIKKEDWKRILNFRVVAVSIRTYWVTKYKKGINSIERYCVLPLFTSASGCIGGVLDSEKKHTDKVQDTKPDKKMRSRLQQLTTRNARSTNALITFHFLWKFLISRCLTVHLQYSNAEKERPLHLWRLLTCYEAASEWWWLAGLRGATRRSHQTKTKI